MYPTSYIPGQSSPPDNTAIEYYPDQIVWCPNGTYSSSSIQMLGKDCLMYIMSFLVDGDDLLACRQVNRQWNTIASLDIVWSTRTLHPHTSVEYKIPLYRQYVQQTLKGVSLSHVPTLEWLSRYFCYGPGGADLLGYFLVGLGTRLHHHIPSSYALCLSYNDIVWYITRAGDTHFICTTTTQRYTVTYSLATLLATYKK